MASKTHKDRVQEFNSKLEMLSEHHDIPKVSPRPFVCVLSTQPDKPPYRLDLDNDLMADWNVELGLGVQKSFNIWVNPS